jgi:hypothetical protein
MIEHGHLNAAVNRLYYACFYAVSALLYASGLSSSKHGGVIALFQKHWVKTGKVPAAHGRFYQSLFERRQKGDYEDLVTFERAEVEELLAGAQEFVKTISDRTREKMADEPV